MTNQELIEKLKEYPKNDEVRVFNIYEDLDFVILTIEYSNEIEPSTIYLVINDK